MGVSLAARWRGRALGRAVLALTSSGRTAAPHGVRQPGICLAPSIPTSSRNRSALAATSADSADNHEVRADFPARPEVLAGSASTGNGLQGRARVRVAPDGGLLNQKRGRCFYRPI